MTAIITPTEVDNLTGETVNASDILKAQGLIELMTGLVLDSEDENYVAFTLSDFRKLRQAVGYQAAWMESQPDLFARLSLVALSQDGVSTTPENTLAWVLSPLAKRALSSCSWAGHKTLKVGPTKHRTEDFLVSDSHGWEPML